MTNSVTFYIKFRSATQNNWSKSSILAQSKGILIYHLLRNDSRKIVNVFVFCIWVAVFLYVRAENWVFIVNNTAVHQMPESRSFAPCDLRARAVWMAWDVLRIKAAAVKSWDGAVPETPQFPTCVTLDWLLVTTHLETIARSFSRPTFSSVLGSSRSCGVKILGR